MICVLDTHIMLWDVFAPERLSDRAKQALDHADLILADISLWEVAMLAQKGRITLPVSPEQFLQRYCRIRAVEIQPITPKIADTSVALGTAVNMDPADRLIMATAVVRKCALVTADRNLQRAAKVEVIAS